MKTATYFEQPSPQLTTLYQPDGKTPYPYWNIIERPAGAINASAKDMAAYLQFYLNRGAVGGVQVIPAASIDRMETPTRTWEAQQGLKAGYGLSNYTSFHDGFEYHGHNGGVNGGITDMSYMPEYGVGYFYSVNSANGVAFGKIGDAIRAYITRNLTRQPVPAVGQLPANAQQYAGWYEPASPRNQMQQFLARLLGMSRVRFGAAICCSPTSARSISPSFPSAAASSAIFPKRILPSRLRRLCCLLPTPRGVLPTLAGP
jgi:CubicO group peptidase (beta-lactamase class C family)